MDGERFAAMLVQNAARLKHQMDNPLSEAGVTSFEQRQILELILSKDGITQAAVGARLNLDPMSVTRQIDRLTSKGLIERRRDGLDGRVRHLHATDLARDLAPQMRRHEQEVASEALRELEDPEGFLRSLNAMRSNLDELIRNGRQK